MNTKEVTLKLEVAREKILSLENDLRMIEERRRNESKGLSKSDTSSDKLEKNHLEKELILFRRKVSLILRQNTIISTFPYLTILYRKILQYEHALLKNKNLEATLQSEIDLIQPQLPQTNLKSSQTLYYKLLGRTKLDIAMNSNQQKLYLSLKYLNKKLVR